MKFQIIYAQKTFLYPWSFQFNFLNCLIHLLINEKERQKYRVSLAHVDCQSLRQTNLHPSNKKGKSQFIEFNFSKCIQNIKWISIFPRHWNEWNVLSIWWKSRGMKVTCYFIASWKMKKTWVLSWIVDSDNVCEKFDWKVHTIHWINLQILIVLLANEYSMLENSKFSVKVQREKKIIGIWNKQEPTKQTLCGNV